MKPWRGNLIASGGDAKTIKGDKLGYATAIMYLAPADLAGGINLCPFAVIADCKDPCLNTAGHGKFNSVQEARIRKTVLFRDNRKEFFKRLDADLDKFQRRCGTYHHKPAVRLNGTSDIQWEAISPWIFENYPNLTYYDYTKIYKRVYKRLPDNYHLTLSYSGANPAYAKSVEEAHKDTGAGVAKVFRKKEYFLGEVANNTNWVDGDEHDLRFLDPKWATVCLAAKGKAKEDDTGFVLDT